MFFYFQEEWRDIPGWEGLYQASSLGRIKGVKRDMLGNNGQVFHIPETIRKLHTTPTCNYYVVMLSKGHKTYINCLVHKLVCSAFHPQPPGKDFVNHIDGNHFNNCPENLEWCTRQENNDHAIRTGLKHDSGGDNSRVAFTNEQAIEIRKKYKGGKRLFELAKEYGVCDGTISLLVKHRTYKTV